MTREPALVRVGDERLAFLLRNESMLPEWHRDDFYRAALDLRDARAALAAMRSTPVGKLMADRDELTQDVQRLMRERDDLREYVARVRKWAAEGWHSHSRGGDGQGLNKPCKGDPCWLVVDADAALAVHGQRSGGENDAASGDAGAEVEQAKSGVAPVALPNDAADSPAQAATPPPPAPSRAELLALATMSAQAGYDEARAPGIRLQTKYDIAARVLAAWEART